MEWYREKIADVYKTFETSESGILASTFSDAQKKYGLNKLPDEHVRGHLQIFLSQFTSPLVYILLIACGIVLVMGELVQAVVIFSALLINAVVGALQEGKAQAKLEALKHFIEGTAVVIRNNKEELISDIELVPGDMVVLREGDKVPADIRVAVSHSLKVDESAITGESEVVEKISDPIDREGLVSGDQKNMLFKGTLVVAGIGRGVVVATGTHTVVGAIASKLSQIDSEMPLKKDIEHLSRIILAVVIVFSIGIFLIGVWKGFSVRQMFSTVVAIAVSAVPEGLPVVVTLVLATGVYRMSSRNVLVKRLQAVEALGQARIIAVDKTGTITRNQMMVSSVYVPGNFFTVRGEGYAPEGALYLGDTIIEPPNHPELIMLARSCMFGATAHVRFSEEKKEWERVSGDPTEASLLVFAGKLGFSQDRLLAENPQLLDVPFDTQFKFRASINVVKNESLLSVVGAPEVLRELLSEVWRGDAPQPITLQDKEGIESALKKMSQQGLRVLAITANVHGVTVFDPRTPPPLCFLGYVGIADVIRPEVKNAVEDVERAGMKVVMITGDHKDTAEAIARSVGIFKEGNEVLEGREIGNLSRVELSKRLTNVAVFARVSPEHKLKIIEAYHLRGDVIAMTGDGVNDALSLAAADLGVAMGKIGTEVAKEAADLILLDDNFGSIAAAVEEGRAIYRTIQKVLLYLISTNVCEMLIIAIALLLGYESPLTASQLIWLNLVTDTFLVVALAVEPKEDNLLSAGWKRGKEKLITLVMVERMLLMASVMTLGTIIFYDQYLTIAPERASTIALTMLVVFQWFNILNCRSEQESVLSPRLKRNKALMFSFFGAVILQIVAMNVTFFQNILEIGPLPLYDWSAIIAAGLLIIVMDELRKVVYRARVRKEF